MAFWKWLAAAVGVTALTAAAIVTIGDRPSRGSPGASAEDGAPTEDGTADAVGDVPLFKGNLLVVGGGQTVADVSSAFAAAGLDGYVLAFEPGRPLADAAGPGTNAVLVDASQPDIDWDAVGGFVDDGRIVYAVNTDLSHLAGMVWGVLEAKGVTASDFHVPLAPPGDAITVPGASAYIVFSEECLRTGTREPAAGVDFARILRGLGAAQDCAAAEFKAEVE